MSIVILLQLTIYFRRLPPAVFLCRPLTPQGFRSVVSDHPVPGIPFPKLLQQTNALLGLFLPGQKLSPADFHNRMADSQCIRIRNILLCLLQAALLQRLPAPVVILQKQVVVRVLRSLKLVELHVLAPLTFVDEISHKICRKALPQRRRILHDGQLPVQQGPYGVRQTKMVHQKPQQFHPAVFLFLQRKEALVPKQLLPGLQILPASDISVNARRPLHPQTRGRLVLRRLFLFILLPGKTTGSVIGVSEALKPFRVILRVGHGQFFPISVFDYPLFFCLIDPQYLKCFSTVHTAFPLFPFAGFFPCVGKGSRKASAPRR